MTTSQLLLSVSKERKKGIDRRMQKRTKRTKRKMKCWKGGGKAGEEHAQREALLLLLLLLLFSLTTVLSHLRFSPVGNVSTTARNCVILISGVLFHSDSFVSGSLPTNHFNFCRPISFTIFFQSFSNVQFYILPSWLIQFNFRQSSSNVPFLFLLSRCIQLHFSNHFFPT